LIKEGSMANFEVNFKARNGKKIPVLLSGVVMRDKNGDITDIVCVAKDITERKQAEEVLWESENKHRTLLENLPQKIFLKNRELVYLSCNENYSKDLKIEAGEIAGKTDYDFYPKELAEKYRTDDKKIISSGTMEDIEEEYIQDGQKVFVHTVKLPVRDEQGHITGILGIFWDITERKQAEQKIKDLARFPEENTNPIYRVSKDGVLLFANRASRELILEDQVEIGHKVPEKWMEMITETWNSGKKKTVELEFGKKIFLFEQIPVLNEGYINSYGADITDRKKAEEKIRQLATITEQAVEGIAFADLDGNIRYVNHAWAVMHGYESAEELAGKHLSIFHTEEQLKTDVIPFNEEVKQRGHKVGEVGHMRKDGTTFPSMMAVTLLKDGQGNPYGLAAFLQDITERKEAESILQIERDKLTSIFESIVDGVYIVDKDYDIQYVNPILKKDFGSPEGKKCHKYFHDSDKPCIFCKNEDVFTGKTVRWEWFSLKNGKTYDLIDTPIINTDGSIYKLEIFRDITDRKKAEEEKENLQKQLFQSQKMEAIGTIASGIAHNFNNILASIRGRAEMALADVSPDTRTHADLKDVIKGIESAKQLIAQMTAFSRTHDQKIAEIDIIPILRDNINMFRASVKGVIEIRENFSADCGLVSADPNQIQHVMLNILTNSFHAIDSSGGSIDVGLSRIMVDADLASKHANLKEGEYVKLSIKDAGHGMHKETVERIFEPFFTTKDVGQGTGLGLSMAHGIITGCGGEITVESEPGKGTTFDIYLPRVQVDV